MTTEALDNLLATIMGWACAIYVCVVVCILAVVGIYRMIRYGKKSIFEDSLAWHDEEFDT